MFDLYNNSFSFFGMDLYSSTCGAINCTSAIDPEGAKAASSIALNYLRQCSHMGWVQLV